MDLIILGGLFLILSGFAFWSLKRNEKKERQQLFDEINPIIGKPLISTEPHNIQQNDTIKSTEPVTASVIVQQSMSKVLKNSWAHFFKSKKYYQKEFKDASKLAVLKMKKSAMDAHLIVNTRVQTSVIRSGRLLEADKICAVASGTAITYY